MATLGKTRNFTMFDGSLYFEAISQSGGDQLVKLNADGTSQTIVLNPNGEEAFPGQNGFTEFDGSLYFAAITQTNNGFNPDLIKLDADGTWTEISTRAPADVQFGSLAGEDGGFIVYNNALYFNSYSDTLGFTLFELAAGSITPVAVDPTGTLLSHEFEAAERLPCVQQRSVFQRAEQCARATIRCFSWMLQATSPRCRSTARRCRRRACLAASPISPAAPISSPRQRATARSFFKLDIQRQRLSEFDARSERRVRSTAISPSGFVQFDGSLYFDAYDSSGGDGLFETRYRAAL